MLRLLYLALVLVAFLQASAYAQSSRFPGGIIGQYLVCPDAVAATSAQIDFDEARCAETNIEDIDPQGRTFWIRVRIDLPMLADDVEPLAVRIAAMASEEVYWNGERLGSNGRVGQSRDDEIPGLMDAAIHLPRTRIEIGENVLAVRISSYSGFIKARRPVHYIFVGGYHAPGSLRLRYYLPAIVAAGAILMAAIYFIGAYIADRRERASLFLGLMGVFATLQLGAEVARGIFIYAYPWHVPRLILVGIFAGAFSIALIAFITTRFRVRHGSRWVVACAVLICGAASFMPGFDGKALLALAIGAAFSFLAVFARAWRGEWSARLTAAALFSYFALIFVRQTALLDRDFFLAVSALMGLLFVDHILATRRDRAERVAAQARSERLELELVRRSIAPHFLMNSLNSLAEWVESDAQTGVRMIEALGAQMRALGAIEKRDLIPLTEELDLVRSFLTVMSYRTDAAFDLVTDTAPPGLMVPPGILHTLTENAFSHNRYASGGRFSLEVERMKEIGRASCRERV